MASRVRHTYTPRTRVAILVAAQRENLTANDVRKKFGVVPVTYYSWRKKAGLTGPWGGKPQRGDGAAYTARMQVRVRAMMPRIVREEVARFLGTFFPSNRGPGRPRKVL